MKTETVLKTVMGQCQYFRSESDMLDYYNQNGKHYIIKDGELIHKGHNMLAGTVETVSGRDEVAA